MKKNKLVDILSEVSIGMSMFCIGAAFVTFSVSLPLFIASLVVGALSIGGVIATAVYNQKQFDKQVAEEEAQKAEENKKIQNMAKLKNEEKKEMPVQENVVTEKKEKNKTKTR